MVARAVVPANYVITPPVRLFNLFSSFGIWGASGGTRTLDPNVKRIETNGSVRLLPSGTGYINIDLNGRPEANWTQYDSIAISFYAEGFTGTNLFVQIAYDNDNSFANQAVHSIPLGSIREGWNYAKLRFDEVTATSMYNAAVWGSNGTGANKNLPIRQLRLTVINGTGIPVWFEGVYMGGRSRPKIVWTWDNWGQDHVDLLLPTLSGWGKAGGIGITVDGIDGNRYPPGTGFLGINRFTPTTARLRAAIDAGWDLCLDDLLDRPLASVTDPAAMTFLVRENIRMYNVLGLSNPGDRIWILNNNSYNNLSAQIMLANGIKYARAGLVEKRYVTTDNGIDNPMRGGSESWDGRTVAEMKTLVDGAILNGATYWPYTHKIISKVEAQANTGTAVGATETVLAYRTRVGVGHPWITANGVDGLTNWSEDMLEIAAYIRQKEQQGLLDWVTPSEWVNGLPAGTRAAR